jgi:LacI family transcriptional regulator
MLKTISMAHSRSKIRRIAVIGAPVLQAQSSFNAALINYATRQGNWKFVFSTEVSLQTLKFLRQLDCDGALIRVVSPAIAREAKKLKFPLVNFSSWLASPQMPTVRCDNVMMGRLAAEHLLQKGFRRFGVVLSKGGWFIHPRHQSFLETIERAGFGAHASTFHLRSHPADADDLKRFGEWVRGLPTPAGLFLTNDDPDAPALMDACRAAGKKIPQDIAVITSHGHPQICHACQPPLTYVDQNEEGVALEAAKFLDRLMSGEANAAQTIIVPSGGVVALGSTDTVAVEDREVAHAVEFIRAHIAEPINIKDVAQHFSIARRTLERRFRAAMGISLHDFQTRERIERAQDLLRATPPLTLSEVARRCGFTSAARLNLVFHRVTGNMPANWRQHFSKI